MGRKHNRMPVLPGDLVIDLGPVKCERVVLMENDAGDFKTLTLTGTTDDVMFWAARAGQGGIVPGEIWRPVRQHAYHGPEDEEVESFFE